MAPPLGLPEEAPQGSEDGLGEPGKAKRENRGYPDPDNDPCPARGGR